MNWNREIGQECLPVYGGMVWKAVFLPSWTHRDPSPPSVPPAKWKTQGTIHERRLMLC